MANNKWIIAGSLMAFVVLTACQLPDHEETIEKSVWEGEELSLECGDNSSASNRRFWKRGDEVITAGNEVIIDDHRISLIDQANLRIVNLTVDLVGNYICTVYTKPKYTRTVMLHIKEVLCRTPDEPQNGGFESESVPHGHMYKAGSRIRYYCTQGYDLVGQDIRTCNASSKGWTPDEPYCEPKYVTQLRQRLEKLEDKLATVDIKVAILDNRVTTIDNKMTTMSNTVEQKVDLIGDRMTLMDDTSTTMKTKLTSMELYLFTSPHNKSSSQYNGILDSTRDRLQKAGELGRLGHIGRSLVSEFTWFVENIEGEIAVASDNQLYYLESQPFYTNVPGYRVKLMLYPNKHNMTYLGAYLCLVQGEFDNIMSWPFALKYKLSSVGRNGIQFAHISINPSTETGCQGKFNQPPPDNTHGCGTDIYNDIRMDNLLANKDQYLIDGSLSIQLTIWLNK